jgi:imidazole glycerol-phosphate synthase subunit HisH
MNKIGVINYGSGNYRSLCNALDYLGITRIEITTPEELRNLDRIILPGVGSYKDCMLRLKKLNLITALKKEVLDGQKIFLGICVGEQVLSTMGTEFGEVEGLGFIPGVTVRIGLRPGYTVPHIGWSEISIRKESRLFKNISDNATFYFVHSYHLKADDPRHVSSIVDYGEEITASVERENIFGVQFHPEKSQDNGLELLRNFSQLQ